jgi:glycosyltransferase involved in cell wall biosynthesis
MLNKRSIAIIDMSIKKTSPAGSCVLAEIEGLLDLYDITVFTTELEEHLRDRVKSHIIKLPKLPLFLKYFLFYKKVEKSVAKLKTQHNFFAIQTTQGQYSNATISYPHYCHKAYMKQHWRYIQVKGLRKIARYINHNLNIWMESRAFEHAQCIVVPSLGLKKEIGEFYPNVEHKLKVIPNPVDIKLFKKIEKVRDEYRKKMNFNKDELVVCFSALGDFERKGLKFLLESIAKLKALGIIVKLLIIGGKTNEIEIYQEKARVLEIESLINFVGFHKDIRPFLWSADIFSLPSAYEVFPLVAVQAAASGLPLLVTQLNGVEEYIVDGVNGWYVERSTDALVSKLKEIYQQKDSLENFGKEAASSVIRYDFKNFHAEWQKIYAEL